MDSNSITFLQAKIIQKFSQMDFYKALTIEQKGFLKKQIYQKLELGYPVDYILGEVEVLGLKLIVKEGIFLPREETEWWLGEIIQAKTKQRSVFPRNLNKLIYDSDFVLDVAAGSGMVGLSLAKYFQSVLAVEKNLEAFKISQKNAQLNQIRNYQIFRSNLLASKLLNTRLESWKSWILCTNLPYVPQIDYKERAVNMVKFEPKMAIYSGWDGLALFRVLIKQIGKLKNPPKAIFLELDPRNIVKAAKIGQSLYRHAQIWKDPYGRDRLLALWI